MAKSLRRDGFRKMFISCFASGTLIRIEGGWKAIELLEVGDRVWSRSDADPEAALVLRPVVLTLQRTGSTCELTLTNDRLRTTAEHPFWVEGSGWTRAVELQPGGRVRTERGWTEVEDVTHSGRFETVYNLRVADFHTYFVGDEGWGFGVWAHNAYTIQEAVERGRIGEIAAGTLGPKRGVLGPLSGKMRFPDLFTAEMLCESKNVARQGWTSQLRDYAEIAKQNNVPFELVVRENTILSRRLQAARDRGDVVISFFKGI